jgi:HK97 family phage major capsid protein
MLNDTSLKVIKSLLDKYGRPIWLPGLAVNAPDTILGYLYVINQSMHPQGEGHVRDHFVVTTIAWSFGLRLWYSVSHRRG